MVIVIVIVITIIVITILIAIVIVIVIVIPIDIVIVIVIVIDVVIVIPSAIPVVIVISYCYCHCYCYSYCYYYCYCHCYSYCYCYYGSAHGQPAGHRPPNHVLYLLKWAGGGDREASLNQNPVTIIWATSVAPTPGGPRFPTCGHTSPRSRSFENPQSSGLWEQAPKR